MLEQTLPTSDGRGSYWASKQPAFLSLLEVKLFIKRFWWLIGSFVLASLLVTALYVATTDPVYTARAQLLIESNLPRSFTEQFNEAFVSLDTPQLESQLALLRSEQIAEQVVKRLKLMDDPEFLARPSRLTRIKRYLFGSRSVDQEAAAPMPNDEKLRAAIAGLQSQMEVSRVGLSYAIDIAYSSNDPQRAAVLANAIADAYVDDRLETRVESARQGSAWLEQRIADIRHRMNAAALAAQQFKARRDYSIGGGTERKFDVLGESRQPTATDDTTTGPSRTETDDPYTLEELEARSHTYRKIYESYLQAYATSVQNQSYPVTNDRVITRATAPWSKSRPRALLTAAIAATIAGLAGLGLALLLNNMDQTVRQPRQVREELGVECLGQLAKFDPYRSMPFISRVMHRALALIKRRNGDIRDYRLREVIELPFSRYSDDMKSVSTAIKFSAGTEPLRTIGIVSAVSHEGKSTFVANFAALHCKRGARVLIVDVDYKNPTLSRLLAPESYRGLSDILNGRANPADCIIRGDDLTPDLLPIVSDETDVDAPEISAEAIRKLLDKIRDSFDLIVFDVPPLKLTSEGLMLCPLLDGVVLLTQWGSTPLPLLIELVHELRRGRTKLLGVVLSKVEERSDQIAGSVGSGAAAYRGG